jgi:hypothetical protein
MSKESESMKVELSHSGDQEAGRIVERVLVAVKSLKEASKKCRDYISIKELRGSTWRGGRIYGNQKHIATVSYNGRIWDLKGREIRLTEPGK